MPEFDSPRTPAEEAIMNPEKETYTEWLAKIEAARRIRFTEKVGLENRNCRLKGSWEELIRDEAGAWRDGLDGLGAESKDINALLKRTEVERPQDKSEIARLRGMLAKKDSEYAEIRKHAAEWRGRLDELEEVASKNSNQWAIELEKQKERGRKRIAMLAAPRKDRAQEVAEMALGRVTISGGEVEMIEAEHPESEDGSHAPENSPRPQDTVPQDSVPQDQVPLNSMPHETLPDHVASQDKVPPDPVPQDQVLQDSVPQDQMPQDSLPQDTLLQEPASQDNVTPDPASQDPASQDPASQDPASQDPASQDPASQDPVSQDPVSQDPASQDSASQDQAPQDSAP